MEVGLDCAQKIGQKVFQAKIFRPQNSLSTGYFITISYVWLQPTAIGHPVEFKKLKSPDPQKNILLMLRLKGFLPFVETK